MQAASVTELDEADTVKWLFSESSVARHVHRLLGLSKNALLGFNVTEPLLDATDVRPGDIDILACEREEPSLATAIECKRVKIPSRAFATGQPTKLGGIRRGAFQTRDLAAHGFHRTILLILVQVDGRERPNPAFFARGMTPELDRAVSEAIRASELPVGLGCAIVELTQPIDKPIADAGAFPMRLLRAPEERRQSLGCTARMRDWLASQ